MERMIDRARRIVTAWRDRLPEPARTITQPHETSLIQDAEDEAARLHEELHAESVRGFIFIVRTAIERKGGIATSNLDLTALTKEIAAICKERDQAHTTGLREGLRQAVGKLLEFVEHNEDCDKYYIPTRDCRCGLDALLLTFPRHPDCPNDDAAPTEVARG